MPVLGTAFLGMGRGILEEEASTVWDGMGGGPRSAACELTGDRAEKFQKMLRWRGIIHGAARQKKVYFME
jgi:hypothetical protein